MRPYHDNIADSTNKKVYKPENNTKWGKLQSEPQSTINKWQQGHMSIEEAAGEPTTSGAINPKFKIPKLSEKKGIISDKLNELAASISPPARISRKYISPSQREKERNFEHYPTQQK